MHSHLPRLLIRLHFKSKIYAEALQIFLFCFCPDTSTPLHGQPEPCIIISQLGQTLLPGSQLVHVWALESEGKAIPPKSFGSTLAQLGGAQHHHPTTDCAGCWQGLPVWHICGAIFTVTLCHCSQWLCQGFLLGFLTLALQVRTLPKIGFSYPSLSATTRVHLGQMPAANHWGPGQSTMGAAPWL